MTDALQHDRFSCMILDNARIHTMDEVMPSATAIAIAGGKVLGGVDSREDVIASHAHERHNLQGACIVPGFVDSHLHFRGWALARIRLDVHDAATFDELLAAVRASDADPVLGFGWADHLLARDADVATPLAEAAQGKPAALVSRDGHALWCTELMLEQIGLNASDLARDYPNEVALSADGRFLGALRERACFLARDLLPEADLTNAAMAGAMREAARRGITTVHDMDGSAGLRSWRALERERGLSLRVVQHLLAADLPHAAALGMGAGFGADRLCLGGIKAFADGTLGSGTAALHDPADPNAEPLLSQSELRELAIEAAQAGHPLLVHAIGDAAATLVVDALEATQEHWSHLAMRPRIEHAQLMRPADIARCAQLGIALSVQPAHLVSDRDLVDERWSDRADNAFAFRTMIDAGCGIITGSDAPIESPHPLAWLHAATTRDGGAHGLTPARGTWHDEQTLDAETALRTCTSWVADATGTAARLGRLLPGRDADLVILSDDPLDVGYANVEVVATMVAGRWTHGAAALR